jgi:hypothetical protein
MTKIIQNNYKPGFGIKYPFWRSQASIIILTNLFLGYILMTYALYLKIINKKIDKISKFSVLLKIK